MCSTILLFSQHSSDDSFGMGLGLLGIGLAIFLFFRWLNKREQRDRGAYTATTGTITSAQKAKTNENKTTWYYDVEYRTNKGEKIQTRLRFRTMVCRFEPGQQLDIYYDPAAPEKHFTQDGVKMEQKFFLAQKAVAALFAIAGIILLFTVDNYKELYVFREFTSIFAEDPEQRRTDAIRKLARRTRLIDLPFYYDLSNYPKDTGLLPILNEPSDTLLFSDGAGGGRVYGVYKDTTNFFLVVNLYAAAGGYIPVIEIFDTFGGKVAHQQLLVRGCGADCGYSCSAIARINKDLSFFVRDSVFQYTCDSLGKETPGTREHYIESFSGKIDQYGNIEKTIPQRLNLK